MYAICIVRYRVPLEEILKQLDAHRKYLGLWKDKGVLLASGPLDPRVGGAILLRIPDTAEGRRTLDAFRDGDPFVREGIAQYEILPWKPVMGTENLDRL